METIKKYIIAIGKFILDIFLRIVFVFRDLGVAIWHGLVSLKNAAIRFVKRFADGNTWTKLSHFIWGAGNFANKQFVKGGIFLAVQIIFIVFMVSSPTASHGMHLGGKAIPAFFTLGDTHGLIYDNNYDFESEFTAIESISDNFSKDYESELVKIYRAENVLGALNEENPKVRSVENTGEIEEYSATNMYGEYVAKQIIYDDRFGTNDRYAYNEYAADSTEIAISDKSLIWIVSEEELDLEDEISFTRGGQAGIYLKKDNSQNLFTYLIVVKTTMSFNNYIVINNPTKLANATISEITYETNLIVSDVDFSFLNMLFGLITFAIIAVFLVVYNLNIASAYQAEKDVREGRKPTSFIEDLKSLLDGRFHITLLAPAIILLVVFTVVPTILMICVAFTDMDSSSSVSGQVLINWTGLNNFIDLFVGSSGSDIANEVGKNFLSVVTWTFEWAILATFSCYFGGIFLALLINKKDVKLKKLWRTIFILTIAVPQFITLLIMRNLLTTNGPINHMLMSIGLIDEGINFLQFGSGSIGASMDKVWLARCTVLVINLYIGIPYTMLMTSGILMNIPSDLYEAATIDGANKWQMFRKITLPYIIFVTTPYLISSFIGNITSFNTIFLTTGGGPQVELGSTVGSTDLLVTWLYKLTIDDKVYNAGSIIGILTFCITAFITLVCYRNSKAYKEEDTFQ